MQSIANLQTDNNMNFTETISIFQSANEWKFPRSTCETPRDDGSIRQPVSAFLNVLCVLWIAHYTAKSAKRGASLLSVLALVFICLFEATHAFSHSVLSPVSPSLVHYTSAMVLLCFNVDFAKRFGYWNSSHWRATMAAVLLLDSRIMWIHGASFWSLLTVVVSSQATPVLCFGRHFDTDTWLRFGKYLVASALVVALIANEVLHCETMVQSGSLPFPPHALVEAAGFVALKWLAEFICEAKPIVTSQTLIRRQSVVH